MRVSTILRVATLSAVLAVPLASAVAFASDDDSSIKAKQQGTAAPDDPDQYCNTVSAVTHPWMVRSDD